jgi:D-xylose transport system substrate-binding protein
MDRTAARRTLAWLTAVALVLAAPACAPESGQGGGGDAPVIALLLPESKTTRYEAKDRPLFEAAVATACGDCRVLYSNADQDAAKQQQQAEAAITNGADVLVISAVDVSAAAATVVSANAAGVPVVDYERLIPGVPVAWYVSYDNRRVGALQAQALVEEMTRTGRLDGRVVMINGSPTDSNAVQFKEGAHSVFDHGPVAIAAEFDTPDWSPDDAQQEMDQAITRLGADGIDGVYAANDGTAGGAVAALKNAGVDPLPPVTGQDAEIAAVQRILAGEQFMTVYKAIEPEARLAAQVAIALGRGEPVPPSAVNTGVDNGAGPIPAQIFDPVVVTVENVRDTVFADGFVTPAEVCTPEYRAACAAAGITG